MIKTTVQMVLQLLWRCSNELLLRKVNDKFLISPIDLSKNLMKVKRIIFLENLYQISVIKVEEILLSKISLWRLLINIRRKIKKTLHLRVSRIHHSACVKSIFKKRMLKNKKKWKCQTTIEY